MTPALSFSAAHERAKQSPGVSLFTVSIVTADGQFVARAYTSHEDVYPMDGLKPKGAVDPAKGASFHPDRETIVRIFAEHELIIALGGTAGINVPLFESGELIGAVNFFHGEDTYSHASVALAEAIADDLRPAILAYRTEHSTPHLRSNPKGTA